MTRNLSIAAFRWFVLLALIVGAVRAGFCEEPEKVSVCDLQKNPTAYNHKLLEVTGFVSHDFEDFTLIDPACPSWPGVWLEYGGTAQSGTMYCCGVTAARSRPKELTVEKIPIPLLENEEFRTFDKAIQPPFRSGRQGSLVHATLAGRFFAGRPSPSYRGHPWGGYGHMGCCTLLAIQQIKSVSPQDRDDLDYGASPDQPDAVQVGCGFRFLTPIDPWSDLIKAQQRADLGQQEWVFNEPERVASEALLKLAKIDTTSQGMRMTRESQGRKIYEWSAIRKAPRYMVIVSRPYWLSFYSHDAKRVAWVVIAAYELSCGRHNTVTRTQ